MERNQVLKALGLSEGTIEFVGAWDGGKALSAKDLNALLSAHEDMTAKKTGKTVVRGPRVQSLVAGMSKIITKDPVKFAVTFQNNVNARAQARTFGPAFAQAKLSWLVVTPTEIVRINANDLALRVRISEAVFDGGINQVLSAAKLTKAPVCEMLWKRESANNNVPVENKTETVEIGALLGALKAAEKATRKPAEPKPAKA